MYYKIVENFGPENGEKWKGYLQWRGLSLTKFDSVDGILRPDLFAPESKEDWQHCVNKDFKINMITDLDYAKIVLKRYNNSALVGVEIELEKGYVSKAGLLGYDIIDGYRDVSLVTNWGTDGEGIINNHVMLNGLIRDADQAFKIRDRLRDDYSGDPHAEACGVWAIYETSI